MTDFTPWASLDSFDLAPYVPPGYAQRQLSRSTIPALCAAVRAWYPDIEIGSGSKFLSETFYEESTSLGGEIERDTIAYVGMYENQIVSLLVLTRNPHNRTLFGEFGVVATEHRRTGVSAFGGFMLEAQARAMNFDMAYTMATLKTPALQKMLERAGFSPVGIIPASDRERSPDGSIFSVSEIIYAKILVPSESLLRVSRMNMTSAVAKLWDALDPTCRAGESRSV